MILFVRKIRRTCLLLFLAISYITTAQDDEFINGLILDTTDSTAVAFATVRILNQPIGVITNSDGSFRMPTDLRSYGDSLEISSLGYQEKIIRFSDFVGEEPTTIWLNPAVEELEEVVLTADKKKLGVLEILSRAIYRIAFNYPAQPFSYIGYYRDYQWVYEDYMNLNEAIIQIYDKGFKAESNYNMDARMLGIQINSEFPRDSVFTIAYDYKSNIKTIPNATIDGYGGNELLILFIHDAIRNNKIGTFSFVDILSKDFVSNHQFGKEGLLRYNNDNIYRISINRQDSAIKVKGEIFISASDFGIVKLDYQVFKLESKSSNYSAGLVELPLYSVLIEYDKKDKYYLKYLSFRNHFEITPPPRFYPKSLTFNRAEYNFQLEFSQEPKAEHALNPNNYHIRFKGRRIHIVKAEFVGSNNKVVLYPRRTARINQILSDFTNKTDFDRDLKVRFRKIRSANGLVLNKSSKVGGDQYREFFVQKVNSEPGIPDKMEIMDMGRPIFKDQPIHMGGLEQDYWMNTPLKK